MKKYLPVVTLTVLLYACTEGDRKQGIQHLSLQVDGLEREYILYQPENLPAGAPLLFVLHGYTGHAKNIMEESGMNGVADKNNFAVCYPQGIVDDSTRTFWQVGYSFTQNVEVDDVKFLSTLAQHLQGEYGFSKEHTFVTGMSNGGDMCNLLACQAPGVFRAVAPVCGCMMKWIGDDCGASPPVPVCMINGTSDDITWWDGDMEDSGGWGAYWPTRTMVDFWVEKNSDVRSSVDTLPDVNQADSSYVIKERYVNAANDHEVWFYKVVNGKHDWPGYSGNMDIRASEEVWRFFTKYL